MNEKEIINIENELMANVYWKRPIVLTRGRGALVWDVNGKEYVDCTGSYGVCIVGHNHPKVVNAINKQLEKMIACHGSFYNDVRSELLKKIIQITPKKLNKVFFGNSGAETVECAIKLARKATGKPEIISMVGAFHGKTMGALSATWKKKYREPFKPLVPGFKHAFRYNIQKIKEAITNNTAAILVEPIQGESGIILPKNNFLVELRELCDEKGILLILDEIQTGFGRTGKFFACEHWNIVPDILCIGKSIASGLPIGVTIANNELMSSFKMGEHTNTFGGNPIVSAAACASIDVLLQEKLPERAKLMGNYFLEELNGLQSRHKIIRDVRGLGLMIGVELRFDILNILLKSIDKGILLLEAGRNIIRFLPPLIIKKEQINRVISVLDEVLGEEEHEKL
jgi:acetylornithine/LysW-gamma-L-lysine aminotransferase